MTIPVITCPRMVSFSGPLPLHDTRSTRAYERGIWDAFCIPPLELATAGTFAARGLSLEDGCGRCSGRLASKSHEILDLEAGRRSAARDPSPSSHLPESEVIRAQHRQGPATR